MDKLSKDQIKIEKTYKIINTRMPDFSMRFFNSMEGILKPSSLYIYSIDIAAFFDYLGSTSCNIKKMNFSVKSQKRTLKCYENEETD